MGPSSFAKRWRNGLPGVGAKPIPVAAGSPWENGYIESFQSRLRDEFLERVIFEDVADARAKASWYRREYNAVLSYTAHLATRRPKSSAQPAIGGGFISIKKKKKKKKNRWRDRPLRIYLTCLEACPFGIGLKPSSLVGLTVVWGGNRHRVHLNIWCTPRKA